VSIKKRRQKYVSEFSLSEENRSAVMDLKKIKNVSSKDTKKDAKEYTNILLNAYGTKIDILNINCLSNIAVERQIDVSKKTFLL